MHFLPAGTSSFSSYPRTWSNIAEQAREIKSYGRIKRFFTGNADARKLEGLVQAINASIQEDIIVSGSSIEPCASGLTDYRSRAFW